MSIPLSPEQLKELTLTGNSPIKVIDPYTKKIYVVIAGDEFMRVEPLLADNAFDIRDTYTAQNEAFSKIWDDPALDVYNDRIPPAV